MAARDSVAVSRWFAESHSAKRPGRPVFGDVIAAFERGEVNALLAWSPNRLSRNAIDTGVLIDLMDRDKLLEIRTPSQTYRNTPNDKFLLGLFCGQAKLENDNKGVDVKRGLRTKATQGIYPAPAPVGYLNDTFATRGNKVILPDPERFDLVRKMFDLMLTGRVTPPQILEIANTEWGFRTARGHKMSRSTIYNIFSRPFYYGRFEYPAGSGTWYDGAHKPMITAGEFHRIQALIRKSGRPKSASAGLHFAYRGPMRCGECRAMITAERKIKRQQNGVVRQYTYYHCTWRKDPACKQASVEERELERQIEAHLAAIEIPKSFCAWGLDYVKTRMADDRTDHEAIRSNLGKSIQSCDRKLDRLIDMRADGEITPDEFSAKKAALSRERAHLCEALADLDGAANDPMGATDRLLSFARDARQRFQTGDADERRDLLIALGSNLALTDKKLRVEGNCWLPPLRKLASVVRHVHGMFEPRENRTKPEELTAAYARNPRLLRALDDVRTATVTPIMQDRAADQAASAHLDSPR